VSGMNPMEPKMANPKVISIDGVDYVRAADASPKLGPEVIIRTYSAGVHVGTLKSREGREVVLLNARRIYSWQGAFTLNAIALNGLDRKNSRISLPVPEITLLEAIEVILVAEAVDLTTTEKK